MHRPLSILIHRMSRTVRLPVLLEEGIIVFYVMYLLHFALSRRRREMYCGHTRLSVCVCSVCLCVCLSAAACLYYCIARTQM